MRNALLIQLLVNAVVLGQVVVFEGTQFPDECGWARDVVIHPADRSIDEFGWFVHSASCFPSDNYCEEDWYRRPIAEFSGSPAFFLEWKMETQGDRESIPSGAPAGLTASGTMGIRYHFTIASDQARLIGPYLHVYLFDIEPNVPHLYRLEVRGKDWILCIDGSQVETGVADKNYPTSDSRITFGARAPGEPDPSITRWDYIRYGIIPDDAGPGDLNCDGTINPFDIVPFVDALSDPDQYGRDHPACQQILADIDLNGSVNQFDIAAFIDLLVE